MKKNMNLADVRTCWSRCFFLLDAAPALIGEIFGVGNTFKRLGVNERRRRIEDDKTMFGDGVGTIGDNTITDEFGVW